MTETTTTKYLQSFTSSSGPALNRIWLPIKNILSFSLADDSIYPQKSTAVSLEKGLLSVAYGSRFLSRITLKGVKQYPTEEGKFPQPRELVSSLSLFIKEFSAPKSDITLCIPKSWTIIRTAEFPSTITENISDAVSYELDRLTPFSADEAFFDFKVLNDNGKRLSLLLMAAKNDMIVPYVEALSEAGFNVNGIAVGLSGIGTICQYAENTPDAVFLEIAGNEFESAIFIAGSLVYSYSGDFKVTDDASKTESITTELHSLIEKAKGFGASPRAVIHIKDRNPAIMESLKLRLKIPLTFLEETSIRLGLPASQKEVSYPAVGGVIQSLWWKSKGLNLLKKGRHEKQKTPLVLTVILIILILAMTSLYVIAPLRFEKKRLQEMSAQIESRKEEVRKVEALKKEAESLQSEIASITGFKEGRAMTLDILKELTSILPNTVWLTRVKVTETTVDIEGYAKSASELLPKLESSKYFRKLEFASPTFKDIKMSADRFVIKMEIEGAVKAEGEKKGHEKK